MESIIDINEIGIDEYNTEDMNGGDEDCEIESVHIQETSDQTIAMIQDTQGPNDTQDTQDTQDPNDTQDIKDTQDTQDPNDTQDTQDTQDPNDTKDQKDTQDQKDTKDTNDTQDQKDIKDTQQSIQSRFTHFIKNIENGDIDLGVFWKMVCIFCVFYVVSWVWIDKSDINIYSNMLSVLNGCISTIATIVFLYTLDSTWTTILLSSNFTSFALELIIGSLYYPNKMPLTTAYIHHIMYIFLLLYTVYCTTGANILIPHALAEISTVILGIMRMFQFSGVFWDSLYFVSFLLFRVGWWIIYFISTIMVTNQTYAFKLIYGAVATTTSILHISWFSALVKKNIKKYIYPSA